MKKKELVHRDVISMCENTRYIEIFLHWRPECWKSSEHHCKAMGDLACDMAMLESQRRMAMDG